ncbi:875_t:CDS:10 [Paraglomus occultum]|uniref:875_t:CDS:1 n=1 Tax=Paraglomus occultum TaxID=144539 RepID=A0A9N9F2F2_9GLOM|nr:875_t:CDS:10 [Paraglomus occultum]
MNKVLEESRSAARKQEDEDLEKAKERSLEEMKAQSDYSSMQDHGQSYDQETNKRRWSSTWDDPENPVDRARVDDTPLGLRPIERLYFPTSVIQALFHVPVLRLAVLAFRPTREDWGDTTDYWRGMSSRLSGLGYEPADHQEIGKRRREYLRFMHELQKLFAFLQLSKRSYGSGLHVYEALKFDDSNYVTSDLVSSGSDFIGKILEKMVDASRYQQPLEEESDIPEECKPFILPFSTLLKSCATETGWANEEMYYGDLQTRECTNMISFFFWFWQNSIYAALDSVMFQGHKKVAFINLTKVMFINIKRSNSGYSSYGWNDPFQIHKTLYMDRYMIHNRAEVETILESVEQLKRNLERWEGEIDKINKSNNSCSGLELLRLSIDYYRQKQASKPPNELDFNDEDEKMITFLQKTLNLMEQRLKELEEKVEKIKDQLEHVFDLEAFRKVEYHLKAVLVSDSISQGHTWAYIWVPTENTGDDLIMDLDEKDGCWYKFCEVDVQKVTEDVVLSATTNTWSDGVYALVYAAAEHDSSYLNSEFMKSVIPESLKNFVAKDSAEFDEELQQHSQKISEYALNTNKWRQDSTSSVTRECSVGHMDNTFSCYQKQRRDYTDPIPLDSSYHSDSTIQPFVQAYDTYKKVTSCLCDGLDELAKSYYEDALKIFIRVAYLEDKWIQDYSDIMGRANELERLPEILKYGRECLLQMHRRSRDLVRSQGVNDAFKVIYYFQALVKEWGKDRLYQQFHHDWMKFHENNENDLDDYQNAQIRELLQWYTDGLPEDAFTRFGDIAVKPLDEDQPVEDVDRLHARYAKLLRDLENI